MLTTLKRDLEREAQLAPEYTRDERDVIEKIRQARFNGFTHYMIVVAEGGSSHGGVSAGAGGASSGRGGRS